MKYLDDNNSVTAQELSGNYKAAYAAYEAYAADASTANYANAIAAEAAADAADAADADAADAAAAADGATYAYATAAAAIYYAKKHVDRYFGYTGENKQDYINALSPIIESPVYTQAMANHNILPEVGAWVMVQGYVYKSSDLDWFEVEVLGHYEEKVIAESCSEANRVQLFDKFKPIDTRTGEEKAFDKFLDDKYNSKIAEFQSSQADRDFIEGLQLAFNSGVTFTGDK